MAFIPKEAMWYLAQLVIEITVEDDPRNVVHVNYMLIQASSPEEAYEKSLRLGAEHESIYLNPNGKKVQSSFKGLRNLTVVYDRLEDGAELLYEEKIGMERGQMKGLVRDREGLAIFSPIEKSQGPNYASGEVEREALRIVERGKL